MIKRYLAVLIMATGFSQANESVFEEVKSIISHMESSGRSGIVNSRGFLGKYQFGAMSLVDIGVLSKNNYKSLTYTRPTATRKAKVFWRNGLSLNGFLNNPMNWNVSGGKRAFLMDEALQDEAMDKLLRLNTQRLEARGFDLSDPALAKSLLISSHFGGVGSASNYARTKSEYSDAYGTKISKYFNAGGSSNYGSRLVKKSSPSYVVDDNDDGYSIINSNTWKIERN